MNSFMFSRFLGFPSVSAFTNIALSLASVLESLEFISAGFNRVVFISHFSWRQKPLERFI